MYLDEQLRLFANVLEDQVHALHDYANRGLERDQERRGGFLFAEALADESLGDFVFDMSIPTVHGRERYRVHNSPPSFQPLPSDRRDTPALESAKWEPLGPGCSPHRSHVRAGLEIVSAIIDKITG